VERIEELVVTEVTFDALDGLPLEERLREAFGVSWEQPMEVAVRFNAQQAPYIRERTWHPSQSIEEDEGGGLVLRFRAGGLYEIKAWILGHGAG
jgi:hypothetical protein